MVRAPCCEKMGLKKGPWTPEEDQILISHIQKHGHANWRALPKQAGLLRCGKSCRLRWINYLRPDIKRGNFTREEEETIIKLHERLGNRWSAIAASLPGRTDNEIKNVWHTHLKKKLKQYQVDPETKQNFSPETKCKSTISQVTRQPEYANGSQLCPVSASPSLPQPSLSDNSSSMTDVTTTTTGETNNMDIIDSLEYFSEIDESFWSDALSSDAPAPSDSEWNIAPPASATAAATYCYGQNLDDSMEFWYDLFIRAGGVQELAEF